jgi:hypothetical protein
MLEISLCMKSFLNSVKDKQIKIIFFQELYISIRQVITFFITGQYKLNLTFKAL